MSARLLILFSVLFVLNIPTAYADVAQEPLFLGGGNVPGNLSIVASVEYPTVQNIANLGNFDPDTVYPGYFDSYKCYDFEGSDTESERHFFPVSVTSTMRCASGPYWSGNYLNWAATQTIDPFRWALTGGYRVKDTATETWLEKARHNGQGTYDARTITGSELVSAVTPFNADSITTYIHNRGKAMQFDLPSGFTVKDNPDAPAPVYTTVFSDNFDYNSLRSSSWIVDTYRTGGGRWGRTYERITTANRSYEGDRYSLYCEYCDGNSGGFKSLSDPVGRGFIFSGYLYSTGIEENSIFLVDGSSSNRGYGFSIDCSYYGCAMSVQERDNYGNSSRKGNEVTINRPTNSWFKFVFTGNGDGSYTLELFNGSTSLGRVTGSDDTVTSFNRVYVEGESGYYVDNLLVQGVSETGGDLPYPDISSGSGYTRYESSVRVKVCDPSVGVESNCKQYSQAWKPEGLMQRYAESIRYSVFGYLNDSNFNRDGGVLRARQKFIGAKARDPDNGWGSNPLAEWDPTTGIMKQNPDPNDASDTASEFGITINDSGTMNYINKFGELNSNNYKSYDPVSELYYAATRYYRGLGNVGSYSNMNGAGSSTRAQWADNFPVITDWDDPIQYSCQKSVIIGIGDVNTHGDQNLPGSIHTGNEPARPAEVSADSEINVNNLNSKVGQLEGINLTNRNFGATANAGYMIGLAYDANTRDIRSDWAGKQTIQTYWVDVLEYQTLKDRSHNQFWLTSKYGGFRPACPAGNPECTLPDIGGPYDGDIPDPLPENWWYTNGDVLSQSGVTLRRADTYFAAGQASDMVDGLEKAFAEIATDLRTTAGSLTLNDNRLSAGNLVYQGLLDSSDWSGDLVATELTASGTAGNQAWSAADLLDALTSTEIVSRKIYTAGNFARSGSGQDLSQLATGGQEFTWSALTPEQRDALAQGDGDSIGAKRVDYLRGDRRNEVAQSGDRIFRNRGSRLGDIVNSNPQFIHHDRYGYERLAFHSGYDYSDAAEAYTLYLESSVYQNKDPVVAVGANDGMFHLFNGETGAEIYAYVPVSVMDQLHKLTDPNYVHRYFVDGTPRLGDAWFNASWHTVAIGTTGAGGSGIFAIDITNPNPASMGAQNVLWEYTNPKMGLLIEQPALVALPNGHFGVVVTSGYATPQSEGYVWILDAESGNPIAEFELDSADLGAPLVLDQNRDRVADRIYVGDTAGNIWRLDLEGSNVSQWGAPGHLKSGNNIAPFFTAVDANGTPQPITAPLTAVLGRDKKPMILFGTGSYYQVGDADITAAPQVQSFYAVEDLSTTVTRADLQSQEILREVALVDSTINVRAVSEHGSTSPNGWYLDLVWGTAEGGPGPQGERVVSQAQVSGSEVVFSTLIPSSDPCVAGGSSWIMVLDLYTGARTSENVIDVNDDGVIDDNDSVTIIVDGEEVNVPASGFNDSEAGIINKPATADLASGEGMICYADSKRVEPICVLMKGGFDEGRISWRELAD